MRNSLIMADNLSENEQPLTLLLDTVVRRPNLQHFVISEIARVLGETKSDIKNLKRTLPFYKHLNTFAVRSLEWRLAACGILTEDDNAISAISILLDKILFQVVTNWAIECAGYCAYVWLERVEAQHKEPKEMFKLDLPNPLEYLKNEDSAELSRASSVTLASFNGLSKEQRQMLLSEFSLLLESIPSQFYIRVFVGFFVFLELYRSLSNTNNISCLSEIENWTDAWLHLLTSSLFGKFKAKNSQPKISFQTKRCNLPVHHILCGLMVSTNSFTLIKSQPCTQRKLLKGLEQLIICSSGFTLTWLNTIKSYF